MAWQPDHGLLVLSCSLDPPASEWKVHPVTTSYHKPVFALRGNNILLLGDAYTSKNGCFSFDTNTLTITQLPSISRPMLAPTESAVAVPVEEVVYLLAHSGDRIHTADVSIYYPDSGAVQPTCPLPFPTFDIAAVYWKSPSAQSGDSKASAEASHGLGLDTGSAEPRADVPVIKAQKEEAERRCAELQSKLDEYAMKLHLFIRDMQRDLVRINQLKASAGKLETERDAAKRAWADAESDIVALRQQLQRAEDVRTQREQDHFEHTQDLLKRLCHWQHEALDAKSDVKHAQQEHREELQAAIQAEQLKAQRASEEQRKRHSEELQRVRCEVFRPGQLLSRWEASLSFAGDDLEMIQDQLTSAQCSLNAERKRRLIFINIAFLLISFAFIFATLVVSRFTRCWCCAWCSDLCRGRGMTRLCWRCRFGIRFAVSLAAAATRLWSGRRLRVEHG